MKRNNIIFFVVLLLFIGCNSNPQDKIVKRAKSDNLNSELVDTLNYTTQNSIYIPLNDTMELDSPAYYLDTFSISNNRFRIVHFLFNNSYDPILEKFINGQWFKQIEFGRFNGSGEIKHSLDINNDNYKDITYENRWFKEIYFFDSTKNKFIDTVGAILDDGVVLLDSIQNIYCDIQEFRQLAGQINSRLFTFTNLKRVNLFNVNLYNWTKDNPSIITKLILSKCYKKTKENYFDSLVNLETIKLAKPINLDKDYEPRYSYFDYINFWKKNYKRLMGYSQQKVWQ